jgi:hypothetical protein
MKVRRADSDSGANPELKQKSAEVELKHHNRLFFL